MSRFGENEEGLPWEVWEQVVSRALIGRKGQQALAELEEALLALPERKLIAGSLAYAGKVCAVGAYVAKKRADRLGIAIADVLDDGDMPLAESDYETAAAGVAEGMGETVAWHLAWLNDEDFGYMTDEERFDAVLAFVRRAQDKPVSV